MLVSALQIVAKIKELPPDYAEHVHITGSPTREAGGIAEVNSFSDPTQETPYIVHIKRAEVESNLNVTCTCAAVKLCVHVVAFYAVFKGIKPPAEEPIALPLEDEAIDVEGARMDAWERNDKKTIELYRRIAQAFEELAQEYRNARRLEK